MMSQIKMEFSESTLHSALRRGNYPEFVRLVNQGADIEDRNACGQTPLHVACYLGRRDFYNRLLSLRADVNARDNVGLTPLHNAVQVKPNKRGYTYLIAALLDKGGDVNAQDKNGNSPLQHAMTQNFFEAAQLLILRKADAFILNKRGESALGGAVATAAAGAGAGADAGQLQGPAQFIANHRAKEVRRLLELYHSVRSASPIAAVDAPPSGKSIASVSDARTDTGTPSTPPGLPRPVDDGARESRVTNCSSLSHTEDITRWLGQVGRDIFGDDKLLSQECIIPDASAPHIAHARSLPLEMSLSLGLGSGMRVLLPSSSRLFSVPQWVH